MPNNRWLAGVLAGLLTLAALYGGVRIFSLRTVIIPLRQEINAIKGVTEVMVLRQGVTGPVVVRVQVNRTDNLAYTYHRIERTVEKRFESYSLQLSGPEDEEAEKVFDKLSPYFYGGLVQGRYAEMLASMDRLASSQGWRFMMQMDEDHVFVTMAKDNRYWYRIIPRSALVLGEEDKRNE